MSCTASQISPVGNSIAILARIHTVAQVNVTQAVISTISRTIYLVSSGATLVGPTSIVVANTIFDTLLETYGWEADSTGYNFRDIINGTVLTTAGQLRIVYTIVGTDGMQTVVSFTHTTRAVP